MCVSAKKSTEVVCLSAKKSRQSGMTSHFFVPQGTQDLGVVRQHPRHASGRIIYVVSAAHDVSQVGLLFGSATPESDLCVGPQHQILVGGHAGCSVVPGAMFIPPQGICH